MGLRGLCHAIGQPATASEPPITALVTTKWLSRKLQPRSDAMPAATATRTSAAAAANRTGASTVRPLRSPMPRAWLGDLVPAVRWRLPSRLVTTSAAVGRNQHEHKDTGRQRDSGDRWP